MLNPNTCLTLRTMRFTKQRSKVATVLCWGNSTCRLESLTAAGKPPMLDVSFKVRNCITGLSDVEHHTSTDGPGALGDLPEQLFELGEDLVDRIERGL